MTGRARVVLMRRSVLAIGVLVVAAGCSSVNREELTKEVLKADPEFASVLDKHHELTTRLETYQRELALKRATVEHNIAQLRQELSAATESMQQKSTETRKRMEPDRERIEHALAMANEELQAKRAQHAHVGRQVAQLRKAAQSGKGVWTDAERAQQAAKITELLQDAGRLDREMSALQQHARLLKIKLLLIKL